MDQNCHSFSEMWLGKLPDNLLLHQTVLSQLCALHSDTSFNILYLGKLIDFKSNDLVNAAKSSQA